MPHAGTASTEREPASRTERRVSPFLGEFRKLVPALGALLGLEFMAAYSNGWQERSELERAPNHAAVTAAAIALLVVLVPAPYHHHRA